MAASKSAAGKSVANKIATGKKAAGKTGARKIARKTAGKNARKQPAGAVDADAAALIAELTSKMLSRKYYVIVWKSFGDGDLVKKHLKAHLDFMIGLEKRGVLLGSGPFSAGEGVQLGDGMSIVRCTGMEEARAIANGDPFVINGARTFDLREWTLMEGSISVRVDFSDQTYTIE